MSKEENSSYLSKIKKLGELPVQLEGELYTSLFSQETCVWFEWIHSTERLSQDKGYSFGSGAGSNSIITLKSMFGDLTVYPDRIMLYIAPSFYDKAIVYGKEQYVKEFCLKPDQIYYAFTEKFTHYLPPFRFFPFIPRRKNTWLLALSDKPLEKGCPLSPMIPTRMGRTG